MILPAPVFRFGIIRPPEPPPVRIAIRAGLDITSFSTQLIAIRRNEPGRDPVIQRVRDFLASPEFIGEPERVPLHDQLLRLETLLRSSDPPLLDAARDAIQNVFGIPAHDAITQPDYGRSRIFVIDALLALKIGHEPIRSGTERFARLFRLLELIRVAAEAVSSLEDVTFGQWMRIPIELPGEIFPLPQRTRGEDDEPIPPEDAGAAATVNRLRSEIAAVARAEEELLTIRAVQRSDRDNAAQPGRPNVDALVVAPTEARRISASTRRVLETVQASADTSPFFGVLDRLEQTRNTLAAEVRQLTTIAPSSGRIRVGGTTLPAPVSPVDDIALPEAPHSPVSPAGVMPLLVTRQQIKRYEAGEIAHVENVMQTESKKRETRRLERTEETFTVEREDSSEEERDLQTTERLELQREVQSTLSEEQRFKLGFKLGAKFGPVITEASTEFEVSSASEESSRTASTFAKELTERAASKVTSRIREEQTIRTLHEFEEKNSHGFDNTAGAGHVIGIFQWIDKVYELQVYDYGIRLMFDMTVPEPAAFLLRTVERELADSEGLSRPEKITFSASDLDFTNYQVFAAQYGATVEPPPAPYRTVSHVFSREGTAPSVPEGEEPAPPPPSVALSATVNIPSGYVAFAAFANAQGRFTGPPPENGGIFLTRITMQIGQVQIGELNFSDQEPVDHSEFALLNLEHDSIPVGVMADNANVFYATAEIWCIRSFRALEAWKLSTFDALVQAYRARLSEYEQKLAEAAAREGVQIEGRNPAINRKIEREEYQRLAIKMITNESFADTHTRIFGFDRLSFSPHEANRKGRFARFWQAAIDWDNLQAELLPYYWSRRGKKWRDKLVLENSDPEHAAFLKAGAARLLLAVNPGFERAVLHYLDTGEIWPGGDEPAITNPTYAAMLADLERNRDRELSEEVAVGDPWEIKLPTTLVRLRPDGSLPSWAKDENGAWLPVEPG